MFWCIIKACTVEDFDKHTNNMKSFDMAADMYVSAIKPEIYTLSFFPGPRFGHFVSNIVEAVNVFYLEE